MDIQIDQEQIIMKFKRNGHNINKMSLDKIVDHLRQGQNMSKGLDGLVKKVNEMSITATDQNKEDVIRNAIQLINNGNSKFKSYDEVVLDMRKWVIYSLSPYEYNNESLFLERPNKELFQFVPMEKQKQNVDHYKKIYEYNKDFDKGQHFFVGVLYESYSAITQMNKPKLILQNEVNEIEIIFPAQFELDCFLIAGCTYVAKGSYLHKDLAMTVCEIKYPGGLPQERSTLLKTKFKQMCQNISSSKDGIDFHSKDFLKYDTIYNESRDPSRPILIFGNVTLNKLTAERIYKISSAFTNGTYSIFILLSNETHQDVDLSIWLSGHKVYLIPHINSEGPRLLPKIPILKNDFRAKVLTNPAKISIDGKEVAFANYPLIKNIHSKNLIQKEQKQFDQQEMTKRVTDLIFSQNSIALCQEIFWRQEHYFKISIETLVIVTDKASPMFHVENKGKGGLACTGNFDRDGDFLAYFPKNSKNPIQFCQEQMI